jgi:predicted nucleic acid-binding protein
MFLLDTNVVSALRLGNRVAPNVVDWARSVDPADQFLSAITILEIETGALSMERRDKVQGLRLRAWINGTVLPSFDGRILPVDTAVARRCAQLHVPDPRPQIDALIAATALVHGMTIVTRNIADFEAMGVELLNPWQ